MVRDGKIKPLDKMLEEKIEEFESGVEKEKDKDLDTMIWELGDYQTQEPPQEAKEYEEKPPIEEELVEKEVRFGKDGETTLREPRHVEDKVPGGLNVPGSAAYVPTPEEESENV